MDKLKKVGKPNYWAIFCNSTMATLIAANIILESVNAVLRQTDKLIQNVETIKESIESITNQEDSCKTRLQK
jgi:hypothetical protein